MKIVIYVFLLSGLLNLPVAPDMAFAASVSAKSVYASKKAIVEKAWTDNEIVDAIYYAEGGKHARYPYGIRSVKCSGYLPCRKIALRTVYNNKKRFAKIKQQRSDSFMVFLSNKFSPIGAGNDPKGLNKNWLKNVTWYLNHPKKGTHQNANS